MSRWKASGIHLLLSAAIGGAVLLLMLAVWYPWPLFEAAGGDHLIFIMLGVDVTLGPLITLIIFKSGKKSLKFDLTVIALLQLSALAYGLYTVSLARPVYIVYNIDRFNLVTAGALDPKDVERAKLDEFKRLPWGRPRYIAAELPEDPKESSTLLNSAFQGKDIELYPQYYAPYAQDQAQKALAKARPVDILVKRDAGKVQDFLGSENLTPDSVKFLPLRAKEKDGAVLLDAKTGMPLKIILVDPW